MQVARSCLCHVDAAGLTRGPSAVSLGFFDDIYIPREYLPYPSELYVISVRVLTRSSG